MKITVATCYCPVDSDINRNKQYVLRQMHAAKVAGADVAHFPEACLSGYAGVDFTSFKGFDWKLLEESTYSILELASKLQLWLILGPSHRLTGKHKPHNSVYIINDSGRLIDRYDKLFCSGDKAQKTGDLVHYSSGNHFSVFTVKGIRCGVLICHDYRYPELYREYKKRGVQLMFHSYHAGHVTPKRMKAIQRQVDAKFHRLNRDKTLPGITMPASMQAAAASNHVWISCSNTSARQSCWPSFFVRPDGVITGRLRLNTAGILISIVDTNEKFYDSTVAWRDRAMRGTFHSGTLVADKRSSDRRCL